MPEEKAEKTVELLMIKNSRYGDGKKEYELKIGDICKCSEAVAKELIDSGCAVVEEIKKRRVVEIK